MVGGNPCPLALLWKDQHCSTYWLVRSYGGGEGMNERGHRGLVYAQPSLLKGLLILVGLKAIILFPRQPESHLWASCAPLHVALQDTDAAGVVPEHQQLILKYQAGGAVATGDEPPLVLAR